MYWVLLFITFYLCINFSWLFFSEEMDVKKTVTLSMTFSSLFVLLFFLRGKQL